MFFNPIFHLVFSRFDDEKVRELLQKIVTGDSIGIDQLGKVSYDSSSELKSLTYLPVYYFLTAEFDGTCAFSDASWEQGEAVVAVVLDGDVHEVDNLLIDQIPFVCHVELFIRRDAEWFFSMYDWNLTSF